MAIAERDVRAIRFGVVSIAVAVVVFKGLPWALHTSRQIEEDASQLMLEAASSRAVLASSRRVERTLQLYAAMTTLVDSQLFLGSSLPAAASEFATVISGHATDAGGILHSVEPSVDSTSARQLTRVRVRAEGEADVRSLADLLILIESDPHRIQVRGLTITQGNVLAPASEPERLQFSFDAVALARAVESRTK